jgi:hypothetical protein
METGRKVHERKLSSFMKKIKESWKLDINQSVPEVYCIIVVTRTILE